MKPLEEGLEGIIESGRLPDPQTPVGAFLHSNPSARQEVTDMMDLSRLIRENFVLSQEERDSVEPAPGFYARVLARIESQAVPPSIWNFFLEPFSMRLVYASLALAILLFAATVFDGTPAAEPELASSDTIQSTEGPALPTAILASDSDGFPMVESKNQDEDRSATLMQLTTYDQ